MNAPKPATPLVSAADAFYAVPSPSRAIALAIADHKAFCKGSPMLDYIAELQKAHDQVDAYPQLVADRAQLIEALQKTNELVARGHVEGAYNAIAAGPQYAERVMAATASLLRELGEG